MSPTPTLALHTADRRLAAAVASFSGQGPFAVREVPLDGPPTPTPSLGLLDLRGASPVAILPWVEARVRVLAVTDDLDAARQAMDLGAQDFLLPTASDAEIALRVTLAVRPGADSTRSAVLRRLVRHDIRSPLAVILGQCEILTLGLGGPLTDKQRKSLEAIERKAQDLRFMSERLAAELAEAFGWEAHTRPEGSSPR